MTLAILDARDKDYVVVAAGADLIASYVQQAIAAGQTAQEVLDAILAAGLSEGVFPSLAAGESGTTAGQYFWVGDAGTVVLYRNDAGVGTEIAELATAASLAGKVDTAALASFTGGEMVGFIQSGDDAVLRTVEDKGRESVSVNDYDGATLKDRILQAVAYLATVGGGDCIFPRGTHTLAAEVSLTGYDNIRFLGQNATITSSGSAIRSYFNLDGCSDITFEGLIFDARFGEIATFNDYAGGPKQVPIRYFSGSRLKVERCRFDRLYTRFIDLNGSSYIDIVGNTFNSPLQDQNLIIEFISVLSCGGTINVQRNLFLGAATTVNGKSPSAVSMSGIQGEIAIEGNRAEHCGRNNEGAHRLGVFDIYSDAANVTVRRNTALNCREQFMRVSTCTNVDIDSNIVTIAAQADTTYSSLLIESGSWPAVTNAVCKRVRVRNNVLRCLSNRQAFALGVAAYDWGAAPEDIEFSGNNVQNYAKAFFVSGPFRNVSITRNTARDVGAFLDLSLTGGLTMTTTLGTEANSVFDGLRVDDNEIDVTASSSIVPISVSTNRGSPYTGTVGEMFVRRNRLTGAPSGTSIAVNGIFNASVQQGSLTVEGNDIKGYSQPFYLRSMRRATVRENFAPSVTTDFVLTDGSVGLIEQSGNRRSEKGALSGSAVLVSGTVTVSTTEVLANDKVRVWREVRGGTIGADLICNAANHVAGTSLRIDAIDTTGTTVTTDTSTVGWEIVSR